MRVVVAASALIMAAVSLAKCPRLVVVAEGEGEGEGEPEGDTASWVTAAASATTAPPGSRQPVDVVAAHGCYLSESSDSFGSSTASREFLEIHCLSTLR